MRADLYSFAANWQIYTLSAAHLQETHPQAFRDLFSLSPTHSRPWETGIIALSVSSSELDSSEGHSQHQSNSNTVLLLILVGKPETESLSAGDTTAQDKTNHDQY